MKLIFGEDKAVAEWVARRLPGAGGFGVCTAIGVAYKDKPIAGVVYDQYNETFGTLMISIAADNPRWAQRGIILALMHYPFEQLQVRKLWSVVASSNYRAIKLNKGIGFRQEAILARHFGKDHAVVMRMFRNDYQKFKQRMMDHGRKERISAKSA